jgi:exosortase
MSSIQDVATKKREFTTPLSALFPLIVYILLWVPIASELWSEWRSDEALSQGPLIVLIAIGLIWLRLPTVRKLESCSVVGLIFLVFSSLLYILAAWADIVFLKTFSLLLIAVGAIWYLGGYKSAISMAGPIGFLVFIIPWPTTLVDRISFPLQLASSAYAALFAGICGLPVVRDGVQLFVQTSPNAKPVYSIFVAQACSGLTSLNVLLALGYLIAYFTDVKWGWRLLMVLCVIPMAMFLNATRLTFVLIVGAKINASVAKWVHDNEEPVLVFFSSILLLFLRQGLLAWLRPRKTEQEEPAE